MLANPFTKALWETRRSLIGWVLGVSGVGALYAVFWPAMETPEMQEAMASFPQDILDALNYDNLTTASGYLSGSVYGLLVPILVTVFAIGGGTRAVAGDEEAGTLDLLLAHPLSRTRLAMHRVAALLTCLAVITVVLGLVLSAMIVPVGLDGVSVRDLAAMTVHLTLFGATFLALAFAIGAAIGGKGRTLASSSGIAVLAYLAATVIPQVEGLEWVRNLSPYYWYSGEDPLVNGVQTGHALLLAGLTAVLVATGVWRFNRRDVAT